MKRSWGDEFEHRQPDLDADEDIEDVMDDRWEEEGPLSAFEDAADHAFDKEFEKDGPDKADWDLDAIE